ncbi:MAG: hypothetical protein ACXWKN_13630, partial [Phenylobacterium sp.]
DELEGEDDFLDTPIDALIARLCRDLGFDPPEPASPPLAGLAGGVPSAVASTAESPGRGGKDPAVHALNTS